MAPSKPTPIAIVGGGPSGLTFARLLECAGMDYVVFERDTSPASDGAYQGGTLDIHPTTGQEALRRAGLHAKFKALARWDATSMVIQDYRGQHRFKFGENRDAPEIDRVQLRQILLNSLPAHRILWGKTLCAAERDENQKDSGAASIALRFSDGSYESGFRLVVGADGAWSKLRQLITPANPEYAGILFIEGRISPDNPQYAAAQEMVGMGNSLTTGVNSNMCIQQMSDRSYRVYMGIKGPQDLTRPGGNLDITNMEKTRAALLAPDGFFGNWAPDLRAFIADAEGPWRVWPWYRLNPDLLHPSPEAGINVTDESQNQWNRCPGVALLGDAAHIASPNGEGVNQAMYDALMLFERIIAEVGHQKEYGFDPEVDAASIERAVDAYEAEMRPRGREHIEDGLNVETMFFGEDAASNITEKFMAMERGDETQLRS
ncbi:hypothetical protein N7462_008488 [Penicillium macrosclerotiorum]|uniref:uncharacterized protein n=1 Tax=Penicillium macrosclerotiorum TaxID=303699 RepID=UPI002548FCB2|nr:uncharacterized protein N7462_008488 [Penicillium macrosclerotiorum]KAJ5675591.1 hypothetical protein N7462_008488 [Penicillium macrosclerotiorum]